MRIQLELIGYLRTSGLPSGHKGGELEADDGTTLAQLLVRLQVPKVGSPLVAVNDSVPPRSYVLREGDVVQFAPPIAGG